MTWLQTWLGAGDMLTLYTLAVIGAFFYENFTKFVTDHVIHHSQTTWLVKKFSCFRNIPKVVHRLDQTRPAGYI